MALFGWAGTARLVRGEFLTQVNREYVLAARSLGLPHHRIVFKHILPNAMTPLLISASFAIAGTVLLESGLSFLNLVSDDIATWGMLMAQGRDKVDYPHLVYLPGLAIFCLVYSLNSIGNALRIAVDPKEAD